MREFIVEVTNYEFGIRKEQYRIPATSFATAINRGVKKFKEDKIVGRRRIKELVVKATKV